MQQSYTAVERGEMRLLRASADHPLWPAVSDFIRTKYFEIYGARVGALPKTLVCLTDGATIHCAVGLRDRSEPYFSEQYLDGPVDHILASIAGRQVLRDEIVEVSSLVSNHPATCARFMRSVIAYGGELGFNWTFFTATARLRSLLKRIGLPLIDLGPADRRRVPGHHEWGSYYDTDPRVFAIGRDDVGRFLTPTHNFAYAEAC